MKNPTAHTNDEPLHLFEEILLLALCDREGTVVSGAWYDQALAGALLAELALLNKIRAGSKQDVTVIDSRGLGEPLLDDCLRRLAEAKKPRKLEWWVSKLSNDGELRHRAAEGLCRRGILRGDKAKLLLFFERRVYPELDPRPEQAVIERLRAAIFSDSETVDARTSVLLSLAYQTEILKAVFDKKELKARKQRIQAVINGEALGKAAREVLESVQMAVIFAAVIVPIIVS